MAIETAKRELLDAMANEARHAAIAATLIGREDLCGAQARAVARYEAAMARTRRAAAVLEAL